ncbi:hypothetical protein SLOPH_2733 [Spraguea lophii 42_110]|uniref:t-SNARE coiled-coil homology domain-containing protein n=1 Tax=Spraguea lophii (strain 42_110) TaxID=1358809 RepID=S7W8C4_SPRLO|nr:hypothetical protein SLOPH_2733 [Spraguea lophii 42_110]
MTKIKNAVEDLKKTAKDINKEINTTTTLIDELKISQERQSNRIDSSKNRFTKAYDSLKNDIRNVIIVFLTCIMVLLIIFIL